MDARRPAGQLRDQHAAAGRAAGISHLGIQAEDESELAEVYDRLSQAERPIVEQKATTCCYAKSDKQWIADPQGVPWETFLTYGEATVYGESDSLAQAEGSGRGGAAAAARACRLASRTDPCSWTPSSPAQERLLSAHS